MQAIECLLTRNACPRVSEPAPSPEEQQQILTTALRAPDHARLRPWRFVSIQGKGLQRFADLYVDYALQLEPEMDAEAIEQARVKGLRAPWVVVVIAKLQEHPKVPEIEQSLSAGAAAQNIQLACHALGYGAVWRTGDIAYSQQARDTFKLAENEEIVGLLFIGTINQKLKVLPDMQLEDFVQVWE